MLENLIESSYSFQTNFILFLGERGEINFFNIKYNRQWGAQNAHTIYEVLLQKAANIMFRAIFSVNRIMCPVFNAGTQLTVTAM
jgi:hypothetical protein